MNYEAFWQEIRRSRQAHLSTPSTQVSGITMNSCARTWEREMEVVRQNSLCGEAPWEGEMELTLTLTCHAHEHAWGGYEHSQEKLLSSATTPVNGPTGIPYIKRVLKSAIRVKPSINQVRKTCMISISFVSQNCVCLHCVCVRAWERGERESVFTHLQYQRYTCISGYRIWRLAACTTEGLTSTPNPNPLSREVSATKNLSWSDACTCS